jgi:WD40 repeat protein
LDLATGQGVATFAGITTDAKLTALNVINDGTRLVVGTNRGNIVLLEAETGNQIKQLGIESKGNWLNLFRNFFGVIAVAVSSTCNLAIAASLGGFSASIIRLWDITSGKLVASAILDGAVTSLAFADDGTTIVAGDETGGLYALRYVEP